MTTRTYTTAELTTGHCRCASPLTVERRLRIAYIVSRFPHVSETFIVRELNALSALDAIEIELFRLFPARSPVLHPAAAIWVDRLRRPSLFSAGNDFGWWMVHRPLRLAGSVLRVVTSTIHAPRILVRALVTMLLAAGQARRFLGLGIDHVHAHFATYPALAAWFSSRLTGIPYSFTAHAHDLYVDQSLLERKVHDARFVVTVSDFNRRFLSRYAAGGTPVHVVRCGVDPSSYAFRPRRPPTSGRVRALCVASLQEYKGHRVLFEALARGGAHIDRIELELVGDGPLRRPLEVLALELGIAPRVRFLGSLTEPEVIALLGCVDLFVLPSLVARNGQMEGLPVAVVEALACGVPVVATRLSGLSEILADESVGILAEPDDVESLREALERVIAGRTALKPEAGRQLVETEFNVHQSALRLADLFTGSGL